MSFGKWKNKIAFLTKMNLKNKMKRDKLWIIIFKNIWHLSKQWKQVVLQKQR